MGDVINLNKFRKAREKEAAATTAKTNRAKHGRTKVDRDIEKVLAEKANATLQGHKREKSTDSADED